MLAHLTCHRVVTTAPEQHGAPRSQVSKLKPKVPPGANTGARGEEGREKRTRARARLGPSGTLTWFLQFGCERTRTLGLQDPRTLLQVTEDPREPLSTGAVATDSHQI